jgi:hypothetical protein|tara:strand:+ start:1604 stop:1822 length:219 start_codon:yes stop_codon:yes gene_type:complete
LKSGVLEDLDLEHVLLVDVSTMLVLKVEHIILSILQQHLVVVTQFVLLVMVIAVEESVMDAKDVHLTLMDLI